MLPVQAVEQADEADEGCDGGKSVSAGNEYAGYQQDRRYGGEQVDGPAFCRNPESAVRPFAPAVGTSLYMGLDRFPAFTDQLRHGGPSNLQGCPEWPGQGFWRPVHSGCPDCGNDLSSVS